MEEDDEIHSLSHSHHTPGSRSPVSPVPVGRITVTVAAAAPPPPPPPPPPPLLLLPAPPVAGENSLTLALPIQPARNGGGREDCWSEAATAVLVEAWGERYLELSRGNLKQKHWKEVADIVNGRDDHRKTPKTDIQCKNRVDTVKKKYKLEKSKVMSGGGPSKWPFYSRLEHLIGPAAAAKTPGVVVSAANSSQKVPVGIPMGVRASPFLKSHSINNIATATNHNNNNSVNNLQLKRRIPLFPLPPDDDDEDDSDASLASTDSGGYARKRPRTVNVNNVNNANSHSHSHSRPSNLKSKKKKGGGGSGSGWGGAMRELTRAIVKFGEAYEQAESSKIQQVVEMEKQRMKFAKDLELQRMQFFMKTQLDFSQLKHAGGGGSGGVGGGGGSSRRGGGGGGGIGNASNHHSNNNNNNNSDSSN